eukprot:TRINITY_DN3625_c0_g1_i3.p1 TRINITY_DN3625_c0_g1~~TRINITY_DN3625_c0_g1_i3.p1  ORF type:complete len:415 (-),score=77.45 TRINITY_DN3625_c0_g1_i3:58-1269(-)
MCSLDSFVSSCVPRLTELRHHIHSHPELAFCEHATADHIIGFLKGLSHPPSTIVPHIGGTGFLAIFDFGQDGAESGKTVVFRSELDAVPVEELNKDMSHISTSSGVSHKCGHDGHMAILAGLALVLSDFYRPESGRVVLLFQPAEETGAGANKMVDDKNSVLEEIIADPATRIFALHNVPGFPLGSVVLPARTSFASASKGMHVKLEGCTCHASQPHNGHNPALAMCNIVQGLLAIPSLHVPYDLKAIVTIVGARLGDKSFGVSAGEAEVFATLRSTTDKGMNILTAKATSLVNGIASTYSLRPSIAYEDDFSATINHPSCIAQVRKAADECGLSIHDMDEAFPWSEDFGVFLKRVPGAMFGLGMGEEHQPLHGEYYDFPDKEMAHGIRMFASLMMDCLHSDA